MYHGQLDGENSTSFSTRTEGYLSLVESDDAIYDGQAQTCPDLLLVPCQGRSVKHVEDLFRIPLLSPSPSRPLQIVPCPRVCLLPAFSPAFPLDIGLWTVLNALRTALNALRPSPCFSFELWTLDARHNRASGSKFQVSSFRLYQSRITDLHLWTLAFGLWAALNAPRTTH